LQAGRSTFLELTEAVTGESIGPRLLIEKDPLRTPDLPLFLRLFPESSIFMPLRHPCDIALSVWMTLLPLGPEGSDILTCGESGWPQGGEFHHHGGPGVGRFGGV